MNRLLPLLSAAAVAMLTAYAAVPPAPNAAAGEEVRRSASRTNAQPTPPVHPFLFVAEVRGHQEAAFLGGRGASQVRLSGAGVELPCTGRPVGSGPRLALPTGTAAPVPAGPPVARFDYFRGNDPTAWRTNRPAYARVRYPRVFPGVDLEFYGQGADLEYDFLVAPGGDPAQIQLLVERVDTLRLNEQGDLLLGSGPHALRMLRPVVID